MMKKIRDRLTGETGEARLSAALNTSALFLRVALLTSLTLLCLGSLSQPVPETGGPNIRGSKTFYVNTLNGPVSDHCYTSTGLTVSTLSPHPSTDSGLGKSLRGLTECKHSPCRGRVFSSGWPSSSPLSKGLRRPWRKWASLSLYSISPAAPGVVNNTCSCNHGDNHAHVLHEWMYSILYKII